MIRTMTCKEHVDFAELIRAAVNTEKSRAAWTVVVFAWNDLAKKLVIDGDAT